MPLTPRSNISSGSKWEPLLGYSRAVVAGNTVYVSGTVGAGADGSIPEGAYAQTMRALEIIRDALAQAGAELTGVVRTRLFLADMADFDAVAKAHGEVFGDIRPATTIVEVSRLVDQAYVVEVEAVALL
jgi:enamine deaminase RidA (YjgF/YER057c/UK114 family)